MDLANNRITVNLANHLDAEEEGDGGGGGIGDENGDDNTVAGDEGIDSTDDSTGTLAARPKRRPSKKYVAVDLDLGASAYANARAHFERKKQHAAKHDKTVAQNARAVAAAERAAASAKTKETRRGPGGVSLARTPEWLSLIHI